MGQKSHSWKKVHIDQERRKPIDTFIQSLRAQKHAPIVHCTETALGALCVVVIGRRNGREAARQEFVIASTQWLPNAQHLLQPAQCRADECT